MPSTHVFKYAGLEQDPRWTAVDNYTLSHLHPPSQPGYDALNHALENSIKNGLPDISLSPAQGKFLSLQCRLLGVKHILEVGTLGGYSSIWLASSNPETQVTSIEIDTKHADVARENIKFAGLSDRIEVLVGAGLDELPRLADEVEKGKREKFGFTFIDADKENSLNYLDWAVKMTVPNGCIYVDNVVRRGRLANEDRTTWNSSDEGNRRLVEAVGKDQRVDAVVLQTVGEKNYDGFLLAVVK